MCELFGISSNSPVELANALTAFGKRGGETADNPDGWGLAYLEHGHWQLHKAAEAAAHSEQYAKLTQDICSKLLIAHVRKANPPAHTLR